MPQRSKALDGARGLGFVLVLAAHADPERFMLGGIMGVGFFFVLSGFLITKQATRASSLPDYYRRRIQRILPLAYFYLALNGSIALLLGHSMRGYSWHLAFVSDWLASWSLAPKTGGVVGHLWTISVEVQFYLLWPLVLLAGGKHRVSLLLALMVGAIIWRLAVSDLYLSTITLPARIDAFAAGGLAALATTTRWRIPVGAAGTAIVLAGALAIPLHKFADPISWAPVAPIILTGMPLIFAAVVSRLAQSAPAALEFQPFVWAGERAYSLYIWHVPLLVAAHKLPVAWPLQLLAAIGSTLVAAWASHRWIEVACTTWIDRLGKPRSTREAATVHPVERLLPRVELHESKAA